MAVSTSRASDEPFRANVRFFNPITDTDELYFMSQGKDLEIRCTFSEPSGRFLYQGGSPRLVLYRMTGAGEDAQRTPVVSVNLPASGQDYLVFLLPNRHGGADSLQAHAFNDDVRNLPNGSTRIYNLSSATIAIKYGDTRLLINGSSAKTINNRDARWNGLTNASSTSHKGGDLPVHIAVSKDEKWKTVYSTVWYLNEDKRYQVFVIPENDAVRVVQVSD